MAVDGDAAEGVPIDPRLLPRSRLGGLHDVTVDEDRAIPPPGPLSASASSPTKRAGARSSPSAKGAAPSPSVKRAATSKGPTEVRSARSVPASPAKPEPRAPPPSALTTAELLALLRKSLPGGDALPLLLGVDGAYAAPALLLSVPVTFVVTSSMLAGCEAAAAVFGANGTGRSSGDDGGGHGAEPPAGADAGAAQSEAFGVPLPPLVKARRRSIDVARRSDAELDPSRLVGAPSEPSSSGSHSQELSHAGSSAGTPARRSSVADAQRSAALAARLQQLAVAPTLQLEFLRAGPLGRVVLYPATDADADALEQCWAFAAALRASGRAAHVHVLAEGATALLRELPLLSVHAFEAAREEGRLDGRAWAPAAPEAAPAPEPFVDAARTYSYSPVEEVLPGRLFIGNYLAAEDHAMLQKAGVTHVLTVADNLEDIKPLPPGVVHSVLSVGDDDPDVSRAFRPAWEFMAAALGARARSLSPRAAPHSPGGRMPPSPSRGRSGGGGAPPHSPGHKAPSSPAGARAQPSPSKQPRAASTTGSLAVPRGGGGGGGAGGAAPGRVLVHCAAGANRSATIVLSWLVKHERMSLRAAWQHLYTRRPIIGPHLPLCLKLLELDAKVHARPSILLRELEPSLQEASLRARHALALMLPAAAGPGPAGGGAEASAAEGRAAPPARGAAAAGRGGPASAGRVGAGSHRGVPVRP